MSGGTVLVIGAGGTLGGYVASALADSGRRVRGLAMSGENVSTLLAAGPNLEIVLGDVTLPESLTAAMVGVDEVVSFAGVTSTSPRAAGLAWSVNVAGAANVVEACCQAGVRRLVHVSSTAAIGYPADGIVAAEDFRFLDSVETNVYSTTKHAGEALVRRLSASRLDTVVVNPAAALVPGDPRRGWAGLVEAATRGRLGAIPPGGTAVLTGSDLVLGIESALDKGRVGERYILATTNLSYDELFSAAAIAVDRRPPRLRLSPRMIGVAARAAGVAERLATGRIAANSSPASSANLRLAGRKLFYDATRAREELGLSAALPGQAFDAVLDALADIAWALPPRLSGDGR